MSLCNKASSGFQCTRPDWHSGPCVVVRLTPEDNVNTERDTKQLADWLLTDPNTGEPLHFAGPLEPDFMGFSRVKVVSSSGAVWTLNGRLEEGYLTNEQRLENIKRAARNRKND